MENIFIVIHCHFYQPPRENPWIETIEKEDTAYPFHNWNERVTFECYRPNAYGRILDGKGKILEIINNYSYINFNFGPTLLSWLEKKAPFIYQRIIEADRESVRQFGSGNAIAQTYHHIIMPLANVIDQETEIIWGISDFEKRFNRKPESIWLPETAINYTTLEKLIQYGIRYIILSPFQALRIRPLGSKKWIDVSNGRIDTTQPYRCFIRDQLGKKILNQHIDIFFYNGVISKEIAFGELLSNGETFCDRFKDFSQEIKKRVQLIHVATDGETYGHHKKFGDLALSYAIRKGFSIRGFKTINYGAFLKRFPPVYEVEIDEGINGEGSSWSCSHGVCRWKDDCGCTTGGEPGWNQKWRRPLREALNFLRDELYSIYIKQGEEIFKNPLEARNAYIDIILDRSKERIEKFFDEQGYPGLDKEKRIKGIKLLEMQRHALGMFTSCGWFFADISGLETQIILRFAARAIELAEELTGQEIEKKFLYILSQAKSNINEMGDGEQIYRRFIKSKSISLQKLVNQYAIESFFEEEKEKKIFSFIIERLDYEKLKKEHSLLALGRVNVIPEIIPDTKEFIFGVIYSKKDLFRTWVSDVKKGVNFDDLKKEIFNLFIKDESEIAKTLDRLIGDKTYYLNDIITEYKELIFKKLIETNLEQYHRVFEEIFLKMTEIIEVLTKEGIRIPYEIQKVSEIVLSNQLFNEIQKLKDDFKKITEIGEIDKILNIARRYGLKLITKESESILNSLLKQKIMIIKNELVRYEGNEEKLKNLVNDAIGFLEQVGKWGFNLQMEELQDIMGEILNEYVYGFEMSLWGIGVKKPFPPNISVLAELLGFNIENFPKNFYH